MIKFNKKRFSSFAILACAALLTACSSSDNTSGAIKARAGIFRTHHSTLSDPIMAISSLSEQQHEWKGTRYRLGGNSKAGIDCSGFMQVTFRDLFGIDLPRTTSEQAKEGTRIDRDELRTGDLVFFKTGRGPNGKHVGVYVKNGQFLHASTKGGVIYSDMNSPYWSRTFWQARRL
ncbi:NlpC/P60 family protein [Actinobacillus equuli]|uniref:NlpC/P60 family protein n=1 Tax=Actinobacillus equuli TaxID=718 RepID=UPI002418411F|nr:NlpC/P60 family protein [Actinobacillus equuli]MDG4953714.1 NlpC/P60 family protein [Actinobacillus equuli subsp. equuli]WGE42897.1 NlpC/P60 family protein [Actinobacillus equuli subsp. haemolyticus]WGE53615.1 NlpC/P60 family protein [Actinobacillus equuli subsp. haemolyticus]WGE74051.1 NlpC/P60 family protein [Actinobacillus equuli subsp. haemolyticus]